MLCSPLSETATNVHVELGILPGLRFLQMPICRMIALTPAGNAKSQHAHRNCAMQFFGGAQCVGYLFQAIAQ
jgi:hypothetical protein